MGGSVELEERYKGEIRAEGEGLEKRRAEKRRERKEKKKNKGLF